MLPSNFVTDSLVTLDTFETFPAFLYKRELQCTLYIICDTVAVMAIRVLTHSVDVN